MKKQFSSLLLALLMVFTLLPVQVWATEEEGITSAQESQEDIIDLNEHKELKIVEYNPK